MIIAVENIYIGSNIPAYLAPIAEQFKKSLHFAFSDMESFRRFVNGVTSQVKKLSSGRKVDYTVIHTETEHDDVGQTVSGILAVQKTDSDIPGIIRMSYFSLAGHLNVSRDGHTLYPVLFIPEGGDYV